MNKKYTKAQYEKAYTLWRRGDMACTEIARRTGVTKDSIYAWISRYWRHKPRTEASESAMEWFLRRPA